MSDREWRVICLCGSTRFTEQMLVKQWELTKQGHVVLSWCALPDSYFASAGFDKGHIGNKEGVKDIVDEVHKRKIDLCDEVLVLNIGGYIGESTRSEIEYAKAHEKPVHYLEEVPVTKRREPCSWRYGMWLGNTYFVNRLTVRCKCFDCPVGECVLLAPKRQRTCKWYEEKI